jgi:hypothetical protein
MHRTAKSAARPSLCFLLPVNCVVMSNSSPLKTYFRLLRFSAKAKLTTGNTCGLWVYKAAKIALSHAIEALPGPIATHEFF